MSDTTRAVSNFYSTTGEYSCFSNVYRATIFLAGKRKPIAAHYFQAQNLAGTDHEETVRLRKTPRQAADMGHSRKLPLRKDWEKVKGNRSPPSVS